MEYERAKYTNAVDSDQKKKFDIETMNAKRL